MVRGSGQILIVCRANVCRSALAELVLVSSLPTSAGINIESAGVAAIPSPICDLAREWDPRPSWHERATQHRPRQITAEVVHDSDLILTASVAIRGEVARLVPTARRRMFTLVEAARLGVGFAMPPNDQDIVSAYIEYLDRQRLHSPAPDPTTHRGKRRRNADPLSIPDGHGARVRAHRDALSRAELAARAVARQLTGEGRGAVSKRA